MKIALLHILAKNRATANKDVSGGFGAISEIGTSFLARAIENQKKKGDKLPLLSYPLYAAIFKKNNHEVSYHENTIPIGADLVVIHGSIIDFKNEVEFSKKIKKDPRNKNTKICFIGPFVSYHHNFFKKQSDIVIVGEPEEYFLNIKDKLETGIIKTTPIENLDDLPFADWNLFDVNSFSYGPLITKTPFLTIQSSRGCPHSCHYYCPYTYYQGNRLRKRKIENVISEIKDLKKKHKIRGLQFRDPLFGSDKSDLKELCEAIKNLSIDWGCETRLDLLDENTLIMMKNAGLTSINVGIESVNESVLRDSKRKPIKIVHQEKIAKICDRLNIKVAAFYIIALPSDTEETIKETIRYAKKINTFVAQFSMNIPYPGTKYFEDIKDQLITDDFEKFTCSRMVTKHKNLTPEQAFKLREYAYVSYYFRPIYMLKYLKYKILDYL